MTCRCAAEQSAHNRNDTHTLSYLHVAILTYFYYVLPAQLHIIHIHIRFSVPELNCMAFSRALWPRQVMPAANRVRAGITLLFPALLKATHFLVECELNACAVH